MSRPSISLCALAASLSGYFWFIGNVYGTRSNDLEQVGRSRNQIVALGNVVIERRPRREERPLGLKDIDIKGVDLARGASEAHK